MITWLFLLTIPFYINCDIQQCYTPSYQCIWYYNPRQEYLDWLDEVNIKWYCKWCNWLKWYWDCSAFITRWLYEKGIMVKGKLWSYIIANYWIKIKKKDMLPWDLIVWQWTHNHVMTYVGMSGNKVIIKDYYKIKEVKERIMPILKWVKIYYIRNPYYGFNKNFYKKYNNLLSGEYQR